MSGLTRAGDLTVGDTTWTLAELAEKGCPCVCGTHPDDHYDYDEPGDCPDGECACYTPDLDALCEACDGTGGYTTVTDYRQEDADNDCAACAGTGIKRQNRWVS